MLFKMKKFFYTLIALGLLVSCSNMKSGQQKWIMDNLPTRIWHTMAYETVNAEYLRLRDVLSNYASDAISSFYMDGYNEYQNNKRYAQEWGLGSLYEYLEGSTYDFSRSDAVADAYKERYSNAIRTLADEIGNCLYLCDEQLELQDIITDREIFNELIGTPDYAPSPSSDRIRELAEWITTMALQGMSKPTISLCEYDKKNELWSVRMDNADNQYVKFYPRDDGKCDVEYSSAINANGMPVNGNKLTIIL
jgi:hypothetical protein